MDFLHTNVYNDWVIFIKFLKLDKTIWTRFISEIILSGEDPIPKFSSVEEVKKTTDTKLPDLYPVSPFVDLKHQHVWRIENNTGWSPKFNYQAPHLIFINNRNKGLYEHADSWEVGQNNARALMTCMAHATAFAKFQYGVGFSLIDVNYCVTMSICLDGRKRFTTAGLRSSHTHG